MNIITTQFGPIDYEPEAILHFPEGLLGFEHFQHFLLIDQDEIAPLRWLQPVEEPGLAFTVIDPRVIWPDYQIRMSGEDRAILQLRREDEPVILVLVTVPEAIADMTANLMGPLVLNSTARRGRQVVQHDSGFGTRQRLIPDPARDIVPA